MIALVRLAVALLGAWALARLATMPLDGLAEQIASIRP